MVTDNTTLDYYNKNSLDFVIATRDVNFEEIQNKFLSYIAHDGVILDFGCGSGRDTKYFLSKGHDVEAWDGSTELCKIASEFTQIDVQNKLFQDLSGHGFV